MAPNAPGSVANQGNFIIAARTSQIEAKLFIGYAQCNGNRKMATGRRQTVVTVPNKLPHPHLHAHTGNPGPPGPTGHLGHTDPQDISSFCLYIGVCLKISYIKANCWVYLYSLQKFGDSHQDVCFIFCAKWSFFYSLYSINKIYFTVQRS